MLQPILRSHRRLLIASTALTGAVSLGAVSSGSALAQLDSQPQPVLPDLRYSSLVDLDGDGRDEIVGVSHVSNALVAYSLAGDGSVLFTRQLAENGAESTLTIDRWDLQLADLNGDGLGDLVGSDLDTFRVFYGRPDFTFEESVDLAPTTLRETILPADLDADGDLDLILYPPSTNVGASGPAPISLLENLGGGAFAPSVPLQTGADDYQALDPVDVDGDGDTDLVGFRGLIRVPVIVRNLGTALQAETLPVGLPRAFATQPGDVDGDGDVDLLVLRALPDVAFFEEIDLYLNEGGVFQPPTVVLSEPEGFRRDLTLANVDGTGPNELICTVNEPGVRLSIRIYPWTGQGAYGPAVDEIDVAQENSFRGPFATGHLDSDDRDDLFLRWLELGSATFSERYSPRVYRGATAAGAPAFAEPTSLSQRVAGPFFAADIDGDGVLDVIQSRDDELQWRRGVVGSARFQGFEQIAQAGKIELVEDFNSDGRPEIVLTQESASGARELVILENLGGGSFGAPISVASSLPNNSVGSSDAPAYEARDFDSDGDLDFIPSDVSRDFVWSENLGGLSFAAPVPIALTPSSPFNALQPADLNGDGLLDFLEYEYLVFAGSNLSWFQGLGGGAFAPSQPVLSYNNGNHDVLDVNEDGVQGIVYSDALVGTLALLGGAAGPGTGTPGGGPVVLSSAATTSANLQLVDVDHDGLTDLVQTSSVAGANAEPLAWLRVAPLSFSSAPISFAPQPIRLRDFGGDGDLDGLSELLDFDVVFEALTLGASGTNYCGPAVANSSGSPASLAALGSQEVQRNELRLRVDDAPVGTFGFFLASQASQAATSVVGSAGRLCLGGQIGRYVGPGQVQSANAAGTFKLALDLNAIPTPAGPTAALPGSTWFFQAWFRDMAPAGPTSNFTDGVEVRFH